MLYSLPLSGMEKKLDTPVRTDAIILLTWFRFLFYILGIEQVLVSFSFNVHNFLDNQTEP